MATTYKVSATDPAADYVSVAEVNAAMGGTIVSGDTVVFNRGEIFTGATLACNTAGVLFDAYGTGAAPIIDGLDALTSCIIVSAASISIKNIDARNPATNQRCLSITTGDRSGLVVDTMTLTGGIANCFWSQGTGDISVSNITCNQGLGTYIFTIFPADNATYTVNNITINGVVDKTTNNCFYARSTAGTFVCTVDGLTITDFHAVAPTTTNVVLLQRGTFSLSNVTITGSGGNIRMYDAADVLTIDTMTYDGSLSTFGAMQLTGGSQVITLTDCNVTNGAGVGLTVTSGTSTLLRCKFNGHAGAGCSVLTSGNFDAYECEFSNNGVDGSNGLSSTSSGVVTLKKCTANNNTGDGFSGVSGSGTINAYGCTANNNGILSHGDTGDGFTSHDGNTFNAYGCLAAYNMKGGFAFTGDTSTGIIEKCTAYGNRTPVGGTQGGGFGVWISATTSRTAGDWTIRDCIFMDNDKDAVVTVNTSNETSWTVTFANNIYYSTLGGNRFEWGGVAKDFAGWVTSSEETGSEVNPLFVDVVDFELSANSPAVGIGTKTWTGPNLVSSSGEPYPDFDIDIGAVQSKHGAFHPVNL